MDILQLDHRTWAGWRFEPVDDDTPRPPTYEPLASGQRRRYLREVQNDTDRLNV